jgi:hypothetical protein
MRSTDDPCVTDRFNVFKVQIVDPTGQNIFHKKSSWRPNFTFFRIFLLFFKIVRKLFDLIIMSHSQRVIFLAILKNNKKILKNIKFDLQLDFHIKNILTCQINHLNFKDGETIHNTQTIYATYSTVAKLIIITTTTTTLQ